MNGRKEAKTRPPVRPPVAPIREYETMVPQDVATHTRDLARRLELKQARELAYLQRRYDRNTYTPTDQAYSEDQILEWEYGQAVDVRTLWDVKGNDNPYKAWQSPHSLT
jgi:hypothetical protein